MKIEKSWSEIGKIALVSGLQMFLIYALSGFVPTPALLAPIANFIRLIKKDDKEE